MIDPNQLNRIRAEVVDDVCLVVFADNGPGIPRGAEDAVFEPLFSRNEGGRGMGLTMARQLLESHGGSITDVVEGRRKGGPISCSPCHANGRGRRFIDVKAAPLMKSLRPPAYGG